MHDSNFSLPLTDLRYITERAEQDLASLHGSNIFMTGCTAFFGKWLIESLLWANQTLKLNLTLTVLGRNPQLFLDSMPNLAQHKALSFLTGEIDSFEIKGLPAYTHVIHAANLPNDNSPTWPLRHMDAAVYGTRRIMRMASKLGVNTVLFVSSGGAYRVESLSTACSGADSSFKETQSDVEDHLCEPNVYAVTKRFLETYITAQGSAAGIRTPIARCFAFVGPHMPLDSTQALGNFIMSAINGRPLIIKGDGTPIRSYMYGADLVIWLLALLVRGRHGVPYNVGSDEPLSLFETARMVANYAGGLVDIKILGKSVPGNAPSIYIPDTSRARNELGLQTGFTLAQSLDKTLKWLTTA